MPSLGLIGGEGRREGEEMSWKLATTAWFGTSWRGGEGRVWRGQAVSWGGGGGH